ncbi:hypothetical protein VSX64_24590 [Aurantimonas sp. C2-6-R+9]|uniref:Uncharacterized protein n=2 Tax=root TaxID=1 RepID=A0A9C9NCE6_9HYPH|nr:MULTISPECIES: hypothetical protein [unclassified Aurantimonas]MEC5291483.1 hypothetical protein [Aurantimonas sp. C2-3-R2]MEC5383892.1 hypothetical protein [Aurantimonas sp. C2-6-R+9]MEC5412570.1 hypothetical protein [Aurantimonas sp. C2-4-R8]HDZ71975.1 hypothetical protein [Aurantimonas coralicida]HET99226.1 hypothetical protein [Aurantimonas coralicida]
MFGLKTGIKTKTAGRAMKSAELLNRSMAAHDGHILADVGLLGRSGDANETVLSTSRRWRMVQESRFAPYRTFA